MGVDFPIGMGFPAAISGRWITLRELRSGVFARPNSRNIFPFPSALICVICGHFPLTYWQTNRS